MILQLPVAAELLPAKNPGLNVHRRHHQPGKNIKPDGWQSAGSKKISFAAAGDDKVAFALEDKAVLKRTFKCAALAEGVDPSAWYGLIDLSIAGGKADSMLLLRLLSGKKVLKRHSLTLNSQTTGFSRHSRLYLSPAEMSALINRDVTVELTPAAVSQSMNATSTASP